MGRQRRHRRQAARGRVPGRRWLQSWSTRLAKDPIYPGIAEDYRRTHHFLEMLKPDIWLAQHNEYYDFEGKRDRAKNEGMKAWIDPEEYRRFIAEEARIRGSDRPGTRCEEIEVAASLRHRPFLWTARR